MLPHTNIFGGKEYDTPIERKRLRKEICKGIFHETPMTRGRDRFKHLQGCYA